MPAPITITPAMSARLRELQITVAPGQSMLPDRMMVEPPVSFPHGFYLPWNEAEIGAFTYSWSRLEMVDRVGRYGSIAGGVRFGQTEHETGWASTSSFTYDSGFIWGEFARRAERSFTTHPMPHAKKRLPIRIGHDVWIGEGAYLRGGVSVGDGAIIGTHAMVTKDVPPYAIVAGNPARVVRMRFPDPTIERLLALRWWDHSFLDLDGTHITDINAFIAEVETRRAEGTITPYVCNRLDLTALLFGMDGGGGSGG